MAQFNDWIFKSRSDLGFLSALLKDQSFDGELHLSGQRSAVASGVLNLHLPEFPNSDTVRVRIACRDDWLIRPPTVTCTAHWVRRETDWHVNDSGELCWVYHEQWRRIINEQMRDCGLGSTILFGVAWLLRSSKFLICCHRHAYYFGHKNWHREWDDYSHFDRAKPEFLRDEKKRLRHKLKLRENEERS